MATLQRLYGKYSRNIISGLNIHGCVFRSFTTQQAIDISNPVINALTTNDKTYYEEYGKTFFEKGFEIKTNIMDELQTYTPEKSFLKQFEAKYSDKIKTRYVNEPNKWLKYKLKIQNEHLRNKKRIRLDEFLYHNLAFAVFHYNNTNNDSNDDSNLLNTNFELRFRLFGL